MNEKVLDILHKTKFSANNVLRVTIHVSVTTFIKELSTHLLPMEEDSSLQENIVQNKSNE